MAKGVNQKTLSSNILVNTPKSAEPGPPDRQIVDVFGIFLV